MTDPIAAFQLCVDLVKKIHTAYANAKRNQEKCKLLVDRVERINEQLGEKLRAQYHIEGRCVEALRTTLQSAHDIVARQKKQSRLFRMATAKSNLAKFEEVNNRLNEISLDFHFGDEARFAALTEQLAQAEARDQQAMQSMQELSQQVAVLATQHVSPPPLPAQVLPAWHIDRSDLKFLRNKEGDRIRLGKSTLDVYKATYTDDHDERAEVAVKEFSFPFLKQSDARESFLKVFRHEVALLHRLQHPGIVNMAGASELCDFSDPECAVYPFIVMEYLPISLADALYADPSLLQAEDEVVRVAREIASALDYLHNSRPHRIVHHDVKPENVMLCAQHTAKLIDFGLASTEATLRTTVHDGAAMDRGTPGYMAPEKLQGLQSSARSHLVDVYAYGVTLWQLVTRLRPYPPLSTNAEINALVLRHAELPASPKLAALPALALLIATCRALDPALRPEMSKVSACLHTRPVANQVLVVKSILESSDPDSIDHGASTSTATASSSDRAALSPTAPSAVSLLAPAAVPTLTSPAAPQTPTVFAAPTPAPPVASWGTPQENLFAPLDVDAACTHAHLFYTLGVLAVTARRPDRDWGPQMVVGRRGMVVQEGAGLAFFQIQVVRLLGLYGVIVGLVSAGSESVGPVYGGLPSVHFPGSLEHSMGWGSAGGVYWKLPGPQPSPEVPLAAGDRVMVVLDCRARPLLRLLVNGHQRVTHPLQPQASPLYPAVAVYGYSSSPQELQPCVQIETTPAPPLLP